MMRIAVLSDTHIPATADRLPEALLEGMRGSDLIIHAGDFSEFSVIQELEKIAPIECVAGNMDSNTIKRQFPVKKILELEGFRIGIMHGYGAPDNLLGCVTKEFVDDKLDCVIYGHSHIPLIKYISGVLYMCPGSPTDKVYAPYNSFGVLEIDDKITPKIVRL
jgi:uncharacterized protein